MTVFATNKSWISMRNACFPSSLLMIKLDDVLSTWTAKHTVAACDGLERAWHGESRITNRLIALTIARSSPAQRRCWWALSWPKWTFIALRYLPLGFNCSPRSSGSHHSSHCPKGAVCAKHCSTLRSRWGRLALEWTLAFSIVKTTELREHGILEEKEILIQWVNYLVRLTRITHWTALNHGRRCFNRARDSGIVDTCHGV